MDKTDSSDLELYEHLPEWATGHAKGEYVLGAHLPTRDGRRCGNAHIIATEKARWDEAKTVYVCLTDAGRVMRLTKSELEDSFYPPEWISDINEVNRKFSPHVNLSSIEKAKQRLQGFLHARSGHDLFSLASEMALTKEEWELIRTDCLWMPASMIQELDELFASLADPEAPL
ncbi:MAG TPA: hypothetical protein DEP32_03120 [Pseudomonas sp.]|nr:hypothetical protein [Pseudomonas sp.]MBB49194.1 hypothetical protein [Pseudomonadales bacterium]MBF77495.1 hypothetical protein [Pseudomonadales bacterium]HCA23134.1 hypothetical protein [Pseudomonas sp.]